MTSAQMEVAIMPFLAIMSVFLVIWSAALTVGLFLSVRHEWRHRNDGNPVELRRVK